MRKVKDAVDLTTNEKIYFKGHAKATYLSDGRNVEEAISNLPSGESSVFEAVYGVTTYEEINAAVAAGKVVFCRYAPKDAICFCVRKYNETFYFSSLSINEYNEVLCYKSDTWNFHGSSVSHKLKKLDNGNAEIMIAGVTAEVATPQYVESLLGTIINGDY